MLSRDRLPKTRSASIKFYREVLERAAQKSPNHIILAKRTLARNDLFFLLTVICKRKDINNEWLFARCREVEAEPNGCLDLWAREHYKSTIITFGLTIQDIIASHGDDPEPRYNGREVTVGLFSHTRPIAKAFLRQIKHELETNEELIRLFPDVLYAKPREQSPKWSEDEGLVVKRKTNPKEATVEASGLVDGQPTSKHFFIRTYDDVVTRESVGTPEMIQKTTQAWELSDNLGVEDGWVRYAGTRYNQFDTYRVMMDREVVKVRLYPCTSDGSEDFTKAVLRSPEWLAEKRKVQGPYTFGAQMLLNPTADKAQGFRTEWLKYWPATSAVNLNVYIIVDPASKKKKKNDYTSMWVIGCGGDKSYYALDAVRDRLNLRQRAAMLFSLHRKWRPKAVGYEEYGLQADIEHCEYMMGQENYRFTITKLGGKLAKEDRIKRLVPIFEQGRLYLPQSGIVRTNHEGHSVDVIRSFVQEEYEAFPVCTHDDALDSLSRILDDEMSVTWPTPIDETHPEWMREHLDDDGGSDFMTA